MRCLNWKVIGGLAAAAGAVWLFAPSVAAGVLPLLVLAACPLSMLLMMRVMGMGGTADATARAEERNEMATMCEELTALRADRASRGQAGRA